MSDLRHSPLESAHLSLGARMVPFAGWNMPVQYSSIIDEHRAVRQKVGIFDISHMGQVFISGPGALDQLNRLLTNDLARLAIGDGQYTIMLNEKGGVIDDLIAYRSAAEEYFLVINASKIDEDVAWLASHLSDGATMRNESEKWAGLAIQGPQAAQVFAGVFPAEILPPRNGIAILANGSIVCRTGYTGEDGFELVLPAEGAEALWRQLIARGVKPCGLGARDTLRLEAGMNLWGQDMDDGVSPLDAGLKWTVDLEGRRDFLRGHGRTKLPAPA